jgi:hypothetical protein
LMESLPNAFANLKKQGTTVLWWWKIER